MRYCICIYIYIYLSAALRARGSVMIHRDAESLLHEADAASCVSVSPADPVRRVIPRRTGLYHDTVHIKMKHDIAAAPPLYHASHDTVQPHRHPRRRSRARVFARALGGGARLYHFIIKCFMIVIS